MPSIRRRRVELLLVSVSVLASACVVQEALPKLLAAAEGRGTRILPMSMTARLFRRTTLSAASRKGWISIFLGQAN